MRFMHLLLCLSLFILVSGVWGVPLIARRVLQPVLVFDANTPLHGIYLVLAATLRIH